MQYLVTLLIVLIVLLVIVLGVAEILRRNAEKPEATRKWTDPKYHD